MAVEDEPREHSPPSSRRRSAQSSKGWDSGGLRGGSTWHRPTGGSLARSTTCTTGLSVSEVLTVLDRALGVGVATSNHLLTLYSAGYPAKRPGGDAGFGGVRARHVDAHQPSPVQ